MKSFLLYSSGTKYNWLYSLMETKKIKQCAVAWLEENTEPTHGLDCYQYFLFVERETPPTLRVYENDQCVDPLWTHHITSNSTIVPHDRAEFEAAFDMDDAGEMLFNLVRRIDMRDAPSLPTWNQFLVWTSSLLQIFEQSPLQSMAAEAVLAFVTKFWPKLDDLDAWFFVRSWLAPGIIPIAPLAVLVFKRYQTMEERWVALMEIKMDEWRARCPALPDALMFDLMVTWTNTQADTPVSVKRQAPSGGGGGARMKRDTVIVEAETTKPLVEFYPRLPPCIQGILDKPYTDTADPHLHYVHRTVLLLFLWHHCKDDAAQMQRWWYDANKGDKRFPGGMTQEQFYAYGHDKDTYLSKVSAALFLKKEDKNYTPHGCASLSELHLCGCAAPTVDIEDIGLASNQRRCAKEFFKQHNRTFESIYSPANYSKLTKTNKDDACIVS